MNLKDVRVLGLAVFFALICVAQGVPGDLDPPGPPDATSAYSLMDLYLRLTTGASGSPVVFTEPADGPDTPTMYSLDEIMGVAPAVDDTNGGTAANVLFESTFWGLTSGEWGEQTGAMPDNGALSFTPTTTSQTVPVGFHNGGGVVEGDQNLVAANIKSGVNIFGVAGSLAGCYGGGGNWSGCSSTCGCQAGYICVDLRVDLLFGNDTLQECVLTLYPPPGLPIREKRCLDWAAMAAEITADSECQNAFAAGYNPYEYMIPLH